MKEIENVICFFYLKFVVSTVHSVQCVVCLIILRNYQQFTLGRHQPLSGLQRPGRCQSFLLMFTLKGWTAGTLHLPLCAQRN